MRAFMLEVPESLLEERRRTGADRHDEMWNGVLHMVPPPSGWHQAFASKLYDAIKPVAAKRGFETLYEIGLFRPGAVKADYRQPDIAVFHPRFFSKRGIDGADFVVEVLSPDDESHDKLPWYLQDVGVREALVVDPDTRAVELWVPGDDKPRKLDADAQGSVRSAVLVMTFAQIAGPKLRVSWEGGAVEI